jgi:hypothetical protein
VRGLLRARFRSSLSGLLDTRRVTVTPCVGASPCCVRDDRALPKDLCARKVTWSPRPLSERRKGVDPRGDPAVTG